MTVLDKTAGNDLVRSLIGDADVPADCDKPRLLVENAAPDRTIATLRDLLVDAGSFFDRGVPVRLADDKIHGGVVAQALTPDVLVLLIHGVCRPFAFKEKNGVLQEVDVRFPRALAAMYLEWRGEWRLPPLNGIASAPLLEDDGVIQSAEGYDTTTGMWRERVPDLRHHVPGSPTDVEAEAAFRLLRHTFRTFCFADSEMVDEDGIKVVDVDRSPGKDESAFLVALLTAVCRPSLHHAPGILFKAAPLSGAGAGKGLLARCIALIAFGHEPHAVTGGIKVDEMEKRITAELIEGSPVLFLDNLNNTALRSDLLASAITERPARVRVLGRSQMVPLNASSLVVLTGNGLTVSEDLARRFIAVELDPQTEDPESRRFTNDIRAEVTKDRTKLLAAALTIWRWGRRPADLPAGRPLGSFETWCRWVRDPLLALGCVDPVARIAEAKQQDGRRLHAVNLFETWWARHEGQPTRARDLHNDVLDLLDPQGRGRQYRAAQLDRLVGTRLAGFVLTRQAAAGKWGRATFALARTPGSDASGSYPDHWGHGTGIGGAGDPSGSMQEPHEGAIPHEARSLDGPMTPMSPMPSRSGDAQDRSGDGGGGGHAPNPEDSARPETHRGHRARRGEHETSLAGKPRSSHDSGDPRVEVAPPYAAADDPDHRGHRQGIEATNPKTCGIGEPRESANPTHDRCSEDPMPPMPPMPSEPPDEAEEEPQCDWGVRI